MKWLLLSVERVLLLVGNGFSLANTVSLWLNHFLLLVDLYFVLGEDTSSGLCLGGKCYGLLLVEIVFFC